MVTISHVIREILDHHTLLKEAFNQKIVSFNKVANILKPEIEEKLGKKVKQNAIVMALRRNAEQIDKSPSKPSFEYSIETIKTDISYIVLEESPNLLNKIEKLYPIVDFKKGGLLNIIQGNCEISIITNDKYKKKVLDVLYGENVLDTIDNLVSISLIFTKDFLYTPGIIYDISKYIAWENINIFDIVLTKTEINLVVDKKDLMRCYKVLGRFSENAESVKEKFVVAN